MARPPMEPNHGEGTQSRRDIHDQALFARFCGGDQSAFRELYSRYERQLLLYCQYLLGDADDAQEVFQETWLRVLNVSKKGEDVVHFRALLLTIARNTALKHLGRRKNQNQHIPLSIFDPEGERLSGDTEGYNELDELVTKALSKLPVAQREAFVLHAMLGYTFHEIAEMQNCTMTGAKTRAFRARAHLRKLLSSWLALSEDDSIPSDSELEETITR
ncbi:MAG: RNA polymerase sigma factor [Chlorobi bacterium CHB2]|nr:RNA polymerase sigma factor [Chlorobi bacterium CHB2]